MGDFLTYLIEKISHNVVLSFKGDAEKFSAAFHKCDSNAKTPFGRRLNNYAYSCFGQFVWWNS